MQTGDTPRLMGIVNVTPDSFSDGGHYIAVDAAVSHAIRLVDEGADIIDIGGESTRPPGSDYGAGAGVVDVDEELRRVIPVIEELLEHRPDALISIDTMKPEVARRALDAGAGMINDVSAGRYDEAIWEVAASNHVPYVFMHGHDPHNRIAADEARYDDVVEEVYGFLCERLELVERAGVIVPIADVGIGFAKGAGDNIRLIGEHRRFTALGVPLIIGASRKAFIGRILQGRPASERLYGTLAAHAVAAANGATILRVHDVAAAREFFAVWARLLEH